MKIIFSVSKKNGGTYLKKESWLRPITNKVVFEKNQFASFSSHQFVSHTYSSSGCCHTSSKLSVQLTTCSCVLKWNQSCISQKFLSTCVCYALSGVLCTFSIVSCRRRLIFRVIRHCCSCTSLSSPKVGFTFSIGIVVVAISEQLSRRYRSSVLPTIVLCESVHVLLTISSTVSSQPTSVFAEGIFVNTFSPFTFLDQIGGPFFSP